MIRTYNQVLKKLFAALEYIEALGQRCSLTKIFIILENLHENACTEACFFTKWRTGDLQFLGEQDILRSAFHQLKAEANYLVYRIFD